MSVRYHNEIKCKYCGADMLKSDKECINCGKFRYQWFYWLIIFVLIALGIIGIKSGTIILV